MAQPSKRAIIVAGAVLAAGVATAGAFTAGSALAGQSSPSPTESSGTDDAKPGDGERHRFGGRHGGGFGPFGKALHGEFVVEQEDGGGTQTVLVQRGEVTAASDTSVTIKSSDGFTLTWQITGDTRVRSDDGAISGIDVGDTAMAAGEKSGDGATATVIGERPAGAPDGGPGFPGRFGDDRFGDRFGHDRDGDDSTDDSAPETTQPSAA